MGIARPLSFCYSSGCVYCKRIKILQPRPSEREPFASVGKIKIQYQFICFFRTFFSESYELAPFYERQTRTVVDRTTANFTKHHVYTINVSKCFTKRNELNFRRSFCYFSRYRFSFQIAWFGLCATRPGVLQTFSQPVYEKEKPGVESCGQCPCICDAPGGRTPIGAVGTTTGRTRRGDGPPKRCAAPTSRLFFGNSNSIIAHSYLDVPVS